MADLYRKVRRAMREAQAKGLSRKKGRRASVLEARRSVLGAKRKGGSKD